LRALSHRPKDISCPVRFAGYQNLKNEKQPVDPAVEDGMLEGFVGKQTCLDIFAKAFLRTAVRYGAISYLAPSLGLDPPGLLACARSSIFAIPAKIVVRCRALSLKIRNTLPPPLLCSRRIAPGVWVRQNKIPPLPLWERAGERGNNFHLCEKWAFFILSLRGSVATKQSLSA